MIRVLQASVLGPALFNISINDLYDGIEWTLGKFGDDMKLERVADSLEVHAAILRNLSRWRRRAHKNLMKFNKKVQSCNWRGTNPGTGTHWGLSRWKAALQKRTPEGHQSAMFPCH